MQTLLELLQHKFYRALISAFPEAELQQSQVEITPSTQVQFGHYQCNSAMKLTKILGKNPLVIAEQIIDQLDRKDALSSIQMISKLDIAGPGFINITLDTAYLALRVEHMLEDSRLGIDTVQAERVIVDFSSPNTAKEMHVGHLRSTIIGDALSRIFEFLGHDVLRLNHIGDWGTAFGMLIAYMKEHAQAILAGQEQTDLSHLVNWYRESKKRFDEDPEFKARAQLEVVALQGGNPESLRAWAIICDISRRAYQEIYDLLDIKVTERGESFYNPMLADAVHDLEAKGLIEISDGAKCIFPPGFVNRENDRQPLIIQKSDGGYNYASTDIAALRHRIDVEKAERIMILTDAGQASHFAMVFKVAEMAGYLDRAKVRIDHVPFGLVLGPDGKKFRTRSGETERLADLLYTGIEHAKAILQERYGDSSDIDLPEMAKALGINAIKYADLSTNRIGDYSFSYEKMLKFEGNTAAFIMYSYVRTASIKRKIGGDMADIIANTTLELDHPSEIQLALILNRFAEVLLQITQDLLPNRLSDYLYQVADHFNAFFRDCRVEGDTQQSSRLLLCEATGRTLRQGMELLGLKVLEKM
ncbi:MAG: arginine--tRNA ligase [Gammaproteobacteria bacterium]|nr:arginine--tRNA ligase [Gammaproteobacteria bacterium]